MEKRADGVYPRAEPTAQPQDHRSTFIRKGKEKRRSNFSTSAIFCGFEVCSLSFPQAC